MNSLNNLAYGISLTLLVTLFLFGCSGEPVRVELPAGHPANPQSEEAAFIPPPNPFQNNIPATEHQSGSSSSMTHEEQQSGQPHQMNSKMEKMHHGSESSPASDAQDTEHQHKENHQ